MERDPVFPEKIQGADRCMAEDARLEHPILGQSRPAAHRVALGLHRVGTSPAAERQDARRRHVSAARNAFHLSGRGDRHDKLSLCRRITAARYRESEPPEGGKNGRTGGMGLERHPAQGPRQRQNADAVGRHSECGLYNRNPLDRCKPQRRRDQCAERAGGRELHSAFLPPSHRPARGERCAQMGRLPDACPGRSAAFCLPPEPCGEIDRRVVQFQRCALPTPLPPERHDPARRRSDRYRICTLWLRGRFRRHTENE